MKDKAGSNPDDTLKNLSPDDYMSGLTPSQRDDTEFLLTEVKRLTNVNDSVVKRIFVRLKSINKNNHEALGKIEEAQMRWELFSTPKNKDFFGENRSHDDRTPSSKVTNGVAHYFAQFFDILSAHGYKLIVLLPCVLTLIFLAFIASPRYESTTLLMVEQPDAGATLTPELALLSSMSGAKATTDNELVKAYIFSNDMLQYLEATYSFSEHYSDKRLDFFSRLEEDASLETRHAYFTKRISADIDVTSGIISVNVQAFTPEYAQLLAKAIATRAEWYINKIGHDLAKAQLSFVQTEHDRVEEKLQQAQNKLLQFQRQYNLIDPEAELAALQQITFGLESQIAAKKAELNALKSSMSSSAPPVVQASEQLISLEQQLAEERQRLTSSNLENSDSTDTPVNQILNQFTDFKIDLEFALESYSASKISLEKSRIEAYRQLKYLVVIDSAFLPEDNTYPKVFYSTLLVFVFLNLIFGIGKLIIATVDELK
ncbi:lipopolysaccharide biosynthesis protein [Agaribacter flavus]|uniref:Lipopolysaccharide biosynthesis protein n=1 Tax=Agaribacter flavus TaxID=1902781 RepID=A0ABV7FRN4_9ALTE